MREDSRIIVITGASSGVGEYAARRLGRDKENHLVLVARREENLAKLADEITSLGGSATIFPADVTDEDSVKDLSYYLGEAYGRVNVLFNNAGLGIFRPLIELEPQEWKLMNDVMVYGTFLCTKHLLPLMMEATEPRHVLVNSSLWGFRGDTALCTAYVAAKFAQRGLTLSLREELRHHDIKVTCLMPGSIDTPFFDDNSWAHDPTRILDPEELAEVIRDIIEYRGNLVIEDVVIQSINPD